MVGFDTSDDASVYKINDDLALVQTVDIFPPVVDDPYEYGMIAAANALSDVYAMGGEPKLALNIFTFPEDLPKDVIWDILRGGYDKVIEAGAMITGGHTIQDHEPKYGLSVTGFVHPDKVLMNKNCKVGDVLILTKPLGTGILSTVAKADIIEEEETYRAMIDTMARLNKYAAEVMKNYHVNSCTDVTGFGLMGHAYEMAKGSGVAIEIDHSTIHILPEAAEQAEMGIIPAGAYRNRDFVGCSAEIAEDVPLEITDILFDPQTSGGLLISLPEEEGQQLLEDLIEAGEDAFMVGKVKEKTSHSLVVK